MYHGEIKIFARTASPRLKYIAGLIFGNILGSDWKIITYKNQIGDDPVINYSSEEIPGSVSIKPHQLLFENGIKTILPYVGEWKGIPAFFLTDENSDIPFDIFAASFFLTTRYEEYLTYKPDMHGRFPAQASLASRNNFLRIPVVDLWAKVLADILERHFPDLVFRKDGYKALLTIDLDQPFAYLGRNFSRITGLMFRDIVIRPRIAVERFRVLSGREKDPYDVFGYLISCIENTGTDVRFFAPAGRITKYDKNPSWRNKDYSRLLKEISSKYSAGIHPSYFATDDYSVFNEEKNRLGIILEKEITISRFHFLRLKIPSYYNMLEKAGIVEDYSMGYADEPGFRAGTARPFMFYNLPEERQTGLRIIPLQVMDATLYQYMKLDPEEAGKVVFSIISETRKVGGLFVSLWHNTSLTGNKERDGWRKLFEKMLLIQKP